MLRKLRVPTAIIGVAALAALVGRCAPAADAPATATPVARGLPTDPGVESLAPVPPPVATPAAVVSERHALPDPGKTVTKKPVAKKKTVKRKAPRPARKKRRKLRADVDPDDFEISGVSVSESGYRARIDGWVRLTRKGTMAQPLLAFDLKDGDGNVIRSGSVTPGNATGPAWLGYDALGLKRVPFTATVDLRAEGGVLPAVPPRPYSASVRVAEVIDAKPAVR